MANRAYFARRFLSLKLLRAALVAGALYDAGVAALLLWGPPGAARLPPGDGPALAPMAALWLAMLAALALTAAGDVRRHSAVIAVLLGGRVGAAAILAAAAAAGTGGPAAVWLSAGQALLAVLLAVCWWPLRR